MHEIDKFDTGLLEAQMRRMIEEQGVDTFIAAFEALRKESAEQSSAEITFNPPEIRPNRAARRRAMKGQMR